jgi:hypothetical protein
MCIARCVSDVASLICSLSLISMIWFRGLSASAICVSASSSETGVKLDRQVLDPCSGRDLLIDRQAERRIDARHRDGRLGRDEVRRQPEGAGEIFRAGVVVDALGTVERLARGGRRVAVGQQQLHTIGAVDDDGSDAGTTLPQRRPGVRAGCRRHRAQTGDAQRERWSHEQQSPVKTRCRIHAFAHVRPFCRFPRALPGPELGSGR